MLNLLFVFLQLTGYSVFLALIWLIITSLSCLPLIEWKLTERRCNDLHSNKWHDKSVYREICVDLLQLGWFLVKFEKNFNKIRIFLLNC